MPIVNVQQPTAEQVKYWQDKGWKHLGFGKFQNTAKQHGTIHFHKDGRTGMKINNYCIIEDTGKIPAKK